MLEDGLTLKRFLQSRRARIRPETVGLPASRGRSRSGLRREDVAELVEVTLCWYSMFESGTRRHRFSATFLNRVAEVLQLDDDDRDTLFRLANATGIAAPDAQAAWLHRRLLGCLSVVAETVRGLAVAQSAEDAATLACAGLRALFSWSETTVALFLRTGGELRPVGSDGSGWSRPARSVLNVPIDGGDGRRGVFRLESPLPNAFSPTDGEIAQIVGGQLSRALFPAAIAERRAG